ncbi:MAG: hypothetical protein IT172_07045 [Acidobacteria bacterium]|nr:hypothetical protein [Acidobacteriota bacterium]
MNESRLVAIDDRTAAATTINTIADKTITDLRAEGIWQGVPGRKIDTSGKAQDILLLFPEKQNGHPNARRGDMVGKTAAWRTLIVLNDEIADASL